MACTGPSKEFAIIKSQEAYNEIMRMLNDKYDIERPDGQCHFSKKFQADWDADEKKLREVLTDLFWTSDCDSF